MWFAAGSDALSEKKDMDEWTSGPRRSITTDGSAVGVVSACLTLLDSARTAIFGGGDDIPSGRIEYRPADKSVTMAVDSVLWYDCLLQAVGPDEALQRAFAFVARTRSGHRGEARRATSAGLAVQVRDRRPCEYYAGKCRYRENCKEWHPQYCGRVVPTKVGADTVCGQYWNDELVVKAPSAIPGLQDTVTDVLKKFVFLARSELERDLLVMPRAHSINREFAAQVDTWSLLLRIAGVECIAFNFGKWESKDHKNRHATDCHAHAHVIFSPAGVVAVPLFVDRTDPPPDCSILDCAELERERILTLKVNVLADKVDILTADVGSLKAAVGRVERLLDLVLLRLPLPADGGGTAPPSK